MPTMRFPARDVGPRAATANARPGTGQIVKFPIARTRSGAPTADDGIFCFLPFCEILYTEAAVLYYFLFYLYFIIIFTKYTLIPGVIYDIQIVLVMERESQNEKIEKIEKTSEVDDDETEDYADEEAMESFWEEPIYKAPTVASCVSSFTRQSTPPDTSSEMSETDRSGGSDSLARRRELAIRKLWMTVTGKKPLNIPVTKIYNPSEKVGTSVFFGDRRPLVVERRRRENWLRMRMERDMSRSYIHEGKITREVRLPELFFGLRCLRFSHRQDIMATSFGNGVVQIRDPDTGEVTLTLQTIETLYRLEVLALRYHPKSDRMIYVGGGSGVIQLFDIYNPKSIGTVREKNNEICNLDISPDGTLLVSVGKDANVYIHDAHKLKLLSLQRKPSVAEFTTPEMELSYHHQRIFGLKYHPTDPHMFVTGGWDYTVKVWDIRVCGAVTSIHGPRICGDSIDLRDNTILTGSWTSHNSLLLWDMRTGRVMKQISVANRSSPLDGEFNYVTRFFDGIEGVKCIVAGGSGREEVEVVNIENNMAIASFPAMKAVTAMDCHDNVVAYGGMESVLRIGLVEYLPMLNKQNLLYPN
ncbi:UNVERIFIED_CONTAM: hypothetical protein PYX00_005731 [Menopon gallinae]|uniref:Uncharacterized protein n=1 Tax=Menopon gallinae TaxID=328185 RepID=A0AAW2HSK5_9NEOP